MLKLDTDFFNTDAKSLSIDLIGKVICRKYNNLLLQAQIIETEAYDIDDKASHSSLGYTEKRKAMFMPAGTIYMYYSRGHDSLNISAKGDGAAVLIKSAIIFPEAINNKEMVNIMLELNPRVNNKVRDIEKLLSGQTLLCKALNIKVKDWDQKTFNSDLFIADYGYKPNKIISTTRLGIPEHRDPHLLNRFVDYKYADRATKNPLTSRAKNYEIIS
ncbi:DNA-3-methyladenine glycosylase [Pseudofrancisella aestuarii]|uniref:Putative 3-methyladenine DNA glycosylase n=1 Tax=Pseudofrancisella aestuarii TaxID=2670347 RepID=A0ABV9TA64_9GAMM|nr:DNA-3-methyladenine glycosylase [Pseudofrancisella aestuarii]